jgi:hypothetical protein
MAFKMVHLFLTVGSDEMGPLQMAARWRDLALILEDWDPCNQLSTPSEVPRLGPSWRDEKNGLVDMAAIIFEIYYVEEMCVGGKW